MIGPFVFMALTCSEPKIINKTSTWNTNDRTSLITARNRCGQVYPDAPCLKVFEKREEQVYRATCGEKNGK